MEFFYNSINLSMAMIYIFAFLFLLSVLKFFFSSVSWLCDAFVFCIFLTNVPIVYVVGNWYWCCSFYWFSYYLCNHLFFVWLDWQISSNSFFRLVLFVLLHIIFGWFGSLLLQSRDHLWWFGSLLLQKRYCKSWFFIIS